MKILFRITALFNVVAYVLATGSGLGLAWVEHYAYELALYSLHFKLALLAAVATLFIHSIVMIYLIVTHKAVKEGLKNRNLAGEAYHQRMRSLKMDTIPWTTTGMLVMIGATIVGAAVDTEHLPRWMHSTTILAAMAFNVYLFYFTYEKLDENTDLLHQANDELLTHDDQQRDPDSPG